MLDDFLCEVQSDELIPEWDAAELEAMEFEKNLKSCYTICIEGERNLTEHDGRRSKT